MTGAAVRYAAAAGFAGAFALIVMTYSLAHIRAWPEPGTRVAQFCIPPDSTDA
jgi:hypothetical protein